MWSKSLCMRDAESGRSWRLNMRNGGSFGRTVMRTDEQVIQEILQQIESAWNHYDSVSLAGVFAEDAKFIHIFGGTVAHRNIFETIYGGSHASFMLRSIRFLRPDVAVVFARAHVKFKEGNEAREIETR